jgi:hypothetical protein
VVAYARVQDISRRRPSDRNCINTTTMSSRHHAGLILGHDDAQFSYLVDILPPVRTQLFGNQLRFRCDIANGRHNFRKARRR